jgi:organic radical activating enzyme
MTALIDTEKFERRFDEFKESEKLEYLYLCGVSKDTFFFLLMMYDSCLKFTRRVIFVDEEILTVTDLCTEFKGFGATETFIAWLLSLNFQVIKSEVLFKPQSNREFLGSSTFVFCSDGKRRLYRDTLLAHGTSLSQTFTWREFLVFNNFANKTYFIPRVDFTVTYECTLNCSYCNMFVPDAKTQGVKNHRDLSQLRALIESLENRNLKVGIIHFVGGEPLTHRNIAEMLRMALESDRFSCVWCTTNGTLNRSIDDILKVGSREKFHLFLTDYSDSIPKVRRKTATVIHDFKKALNSNLVISKEKSWIDFGHPSQILDDQKESEIFNHFQSCTAPYRGFKENNFYYCNLSLAAIEVGLLSPGVVDSVDIVSTPMLDLLSYDLGYLASSGPKLCGACSGCNTGFGETVSPSSQGLIRRV